MLGPAVNAVVVIVCALIGTFLIKGIPERVEEIIRKAIGLSIVYVGIKGAFDNERMLLLIMSMVFGAVIGELINIDKWMNKLGLWAERKLVKNREKDTKHNFAKGFVSATILFCTGSMAIIGSMQSGLSGNHQILFTKSVLDGSISLVFGAAFGIGTAFSAIPLFLYQGGIALISFQISDLIDPVIIREMAAVGSLIISAIGFNFLGVKEIKVANLIPAMFIPWVYLAIAGLFT
ncbi:MAG: DUF554 domain-containing protein [Treponema sp.]|nr:DUF554 domain-containing protein [Treponema sp.]